MPCQWMDESWARWFVTRSVTRSPSRQRRIGPGTEPLNVVAGRSRPVKLTILLPMLMSKLEPRRVVIGCRVDFAANDEPAGNPRPNSALPAATPVTNRRRDTNADCPGKIICLLFSIIVSLFKRTSVRECCGHVLQARPAYLQNAPILRAGALRSPSHWRDDPCRRRCRSIPGIDSH